MCANKFTVCAFFSYVCSMEITTEKNKTPIQNLVSVDEYADLVKKSRRTIYNWIKDGELETIEFKGRQFLDKTKLVFKKS